MPEDEAAGRLRQLNDIVEYYDVDRWGRDFLAAVRDFTPASAEVHALAAAPKRAAHA